MLGDARKSGKMYIPHCIEYYDKESLAANNTAELIKTIAIES